MQRWVNRARALLQGRLAAVAAVLLLCVLSIAGALTADEEANRVSALRFEPSHVSVLRTLDAYAEPRDTVYSLSLVPGVSGDESALPPRPYFVTKPEPIARVGREYRYQPRSPLALSGFTLDGDVVPGLQIDATTGEITGRPSQLGNYEHVKLSASTAEGLRVEQEFPLYVDDRFLLLGADYSGFDLVRRLLQSMKYVVGPGVIVALVSVLGGTVFGAFAGYYGGRAEQLLSLMVSVLQGVPTLLGVFLAAVISGLNVQVIMAVVGLSLLPETADGVRTRVRGFRERDFIEAARELGMKDRSILWTEIVWYNCRVFLLSRTTQAFMYAVLVEVTLSYAQLLDPNGARIGTLLYNSRKYLELQPLLYIAPLVVLLSILALMQFAERAVVRHWTQRR